MDNEIKINGVRYIKTQTNIEKEMKSHPERFERLTENGWERIDCTIKPYDNIKIINKEWNRRPLDNKLFYVEIKQIDVKGRFENSLKEIIRRKKQ